MMLLLQATLQDPDKFLHFLILGFAIMWVINLIYIVNLAIRQHNLKKDLLILRQLLEETPS